MSTNTESLVAADLVARICQGSREAEADMVGRYSRGLLFMLRRQSNDDIADEVAQETWRVVIEKLREGALRKPERLAAYIVQTGRNQLIMYYRRNPARHANESNTPTAVGDDDPSVSYERERVCQFVRGLLTELNARRDREILTRYYLKEEDKARICADFDLSEIHFNRVVYRAKQRLRAFLDDVDREEI